MRTPDRDHTPETSVQEPESRRDRAGRIVQRTGLYASVATTVVLLVLIVILIAENTRQVKVGWIVGYSRVSLVFLVLFATVLGWLLGIATSVAFRRHMR